MLHSEKARNLNLTEAHIVVSHGCIIFFIIMKCVKACVISDAHVTESGVNVP